MHTIKCRVPWYRGNKKFDHFSYWGRISNDIFQGPSSCNFATAKDDEQFTGLRDKNGKEIYEGDIVHGTTRYFIKEQTGIVCFGGMSFNFHNDDGWFYTVTNHNIESLPEIEVIGNIHENPELLND